MQKSSKGLGIGALITGLVSIVMLIVTLPAMCGSAKAGSVEGTVGTMIGLPAIGLIAGILGIVLGAVGMKKAGLNGESKGLAITGMILGIVGTVMCGIVTLCNITAVASI